MTTRAEHMAWCKQRALAELDAGSSSSGFASMCSDLKKHPETETHIGMLMGITLMMGGMMNSASEVRKFIEGFN